MSAECDRCGWDLPYVDDCVVCDERGPFKRQLEEAQGKLDAVEVFAETGCADIERDGILRILKGEK